MYIQYFLFYAHSVVKVASHKSKVLTPFLLLWQVYLGNAALVK